MPGTLFVVATPIGNLEDITARALRVLREVAVIAAEDTRRTAHLLARFGIDTPTTSLHEHNEVGKSAAIVARLARGEDVALVSDAGTPAISDPGARLVRAALDRGLRVETVPGPSAVMAALGASGFATDRFAFFGFPPIRSKDRREWFEAVAAWVGTAVFFEAPHRVRETLRQLQSRVGDRPAAVARELTKIHEEWVRGPISEIVRHEQIARGELTIVVDVGRSTEYVATPRASAALLSDEVGELTKIAGMTKRKAVNIVARRHGLAPNEVYRTLEKNH